MNITIKNGGGESLLATERKAMAKFCCSRNANGSN
jgi:hypothetical protein